MENQKVRRVKTGEIYMCDLGSKRGSEQTGKRPVLVIQCNDLNKNSPTVIVAAITSSLKKQDLPSHVVLGKKYGLKETSMVMLEQLNTVDIKERLGDYVGKVSDRATWRKIQNAQQYIQKDTRAGKERKCRVVALCPTCKEELFMDKATILKRYDFTSRSRHVCGVCENDLGYKYLLRKREKNGRGRR